MGEYVQEMLTKSMPAFLAGDRERIKEISEIDDKVDFLYSEIVAYLGKVSKQALTEEQVQELSNLLSAVNDLESIGDIIETDAVDLAEQCYRRRREDQRGDPERSPGPALNHRSLGGTRLAFG